MKKLIIIVFSILAIAGLGVGGYYLHMTSTPEYALAETIADVKAEGIQGLKKHLTSDAINRLNSIGEWSDKSGVSGILSALSQQSAVNVLKEKMTEVNWTVEDVLEGDNRADVVIGFDYNDSITGSISIIMIKEGREWKIDSLGFPSFDKISLW